MADNTSPRLSDRPSDEELRLLLDETWISYGEGADITQSFAQEVRAMATELLVLREAQRQLEDENAFLKRALAQSCEGARIEGEMLTRVGSWGHVKLRPDLAKYLRDKSATPIEENEQ